MSEWLFDLGNSRLKFAPLLDDGGIGEMAGIAHDGHALAEGWTSLLPARMVSSRSSSDSSRPRRCCSTASRRSQFSTMMTAPSTMMPKSIAPSHIRLALTL